VKDDELRTKHNPIIGSSHASECAGGIIHRVTVSIWAPLLEELGIIGGTAPRSTGGTAVLCRIENRAWVVTTARNLQLSGTLSDDVGGAFYAAAVICRVQLNRKVETFHQGDVVEVEVVVLVQREFHQRGRGCTVSSVAHEKTVAVAC